MRAWFAVLAVAAALLVPADVFAAGKSFGLFNYWADGRQLSWYNFGSRSPVKNGQVQAQPVWVLYTGLDGKGNPIPVPGQSSIFDTPLNDPAYTDLWLKILVEVPTDYVANSITSRAQIEQAGLVQTVTTTTLDCPFADQSDTLAGSIKPARGWLRGSPVWYFDLGPTSPVVGQTWRFTSSSDNGGQPIPVAGQFSVAEATPGAFRQTNWVHVPKSYTPNSIKTVAAIKASGFPITSTGTVFNVPVPPASASAGRPGRAAYALVGAFAALFALAAAYLLRLPKPRGPDPFTG